MGKIEIMAVMILIASRAQQGQSNPAIGFSAMLSKDTHLGDDEVVKYDRVITNVGNGYDRWSGHFRAPIKGLYVFSCTVMALYTHEIGVNLMKNGISMAVAYSSKAYYESGAITILLALQRGDNVWIKRYNFGHILHGNYNWFTGYLISTRI